MTNQEQVDLLLHSVELWNIWREEHPNDIIGLGGADFNGANLNHANLSGVYLNDANLNYAHLNYANLSKAILIGAYFINAHLNNAELSDADLKGTNFSRADLSRADLSSVVISPSLYSNSNFSRIYHGSADLSGANLSGANLSRADLSDVNLGDTDLSNANLSNTHLRGARLNHTNLSHALFKETKIGFTSFEDIDLRTVQDLETVIHLFPSTIGIDTLIRSQGKIPEAFLKGAGVPDTVIEYARSLTQRPIEYYTCFISYSSKDESFAEQLYKDLQYKGVRCWFAPEDLKIGDKFWHRIDESIRLYDKLLVVISEASINSSWVETEVMTALEKEQQRKKLVLFPIRLDEEVMHTPLPWAAHMRRTRHIGNFSHWKDHDAYQGAFTRLLRDLKAESRS